MHIYRPANLLDLPVTRVVHESYTVGLIPGRQHVIIAQLNDDYFKLFQINMMSKDGTVFIDFPYLKQPGIMIATETASEPGEENTVNMAEGGYKTSHRVKYTHHVDGEAHFSQDSKIFTIVRQKAVPLRSINGHMFTVTVAGYTGFARHHGDLQGKGDRANLSFDLTNWPNSWLRVVGRLFTPEQHAMVLENYPAEVRSAEVIGPSFDWHEPEVNRRTHRVLITWPKNSAMSGCVMELSLEVVTYWEPAVRPTLFFMGGFGSTISTALANGSGPIRYLALKYPFDGQGKLERFVPSIDLDEKAIYPNIVI